MFMFDVLLEWSKNDTPQYEDQLRVPWMVDPN
jgi:hypothetical protein